MKKTIIAGAASLALAAMPMAGVFAATTGTASLTDEFSVGVKATCELGTDNGASSNTNQYTVTDQTPGTLITFGSQATVIDVNCNNSKGYSITPTFTGLTANSNVDKIEYSATTATAGSGTWTASYTKNGASEKANFTGGTAITGTSSMTDYYTITYLVGLGDNQAAGTYTGNATYQLSDNN